MDEPSLFEIDFDLTLAMASAQDYHIFVAPVQNYETFPRIQKLNDNDPKGEKEQAETLDGAQDEIHDEDEPTGPGREQGNTDLVPAPAPRSRPTERPRGRENWDLFRNYDLPSGEMPTPKTILDDFFVLLVMMNFKGDMRFLCWPVNFLPKGLIDYRFLGTGRPAKVWSENKNQWEYAIVGGIKLHGEEGAGKYQRVVGIRSASREISSERKADIQRDEPGSENQDLTRARIQVSVQWWDQKEDRKTAKAVQAVGPSTASGHYTRAGTKRMQETFKPSISKSSKRHKRASSSLDRHLQFRGRREFKVLTTATFVVSVGDRRS